MFTKENNGVTRTFKDVEAIEVYEGQGKTDSCHISQEIVTEYPSARMGNEFSTGLFTAETGKIYKTMRYTFVPVPSGMNVEDTQKQLSNFENGCIYRITTNKLDDILTEGDLWGIENGFTDREKLIKRYEVQDSEGNMYACGVINTGQLPKEFKRDFYNNAFKEDIDKREHKSANVAETPQISMMETPVESEFEKQAF